MGGSVGGWVGGWVGNDLNKKWDEIFLLSKNFRSKRQNVEGNTFIIICLKAVVGLIAWSCIPKLDCLNMDFQNWIEAMNKGFVWIKL